MPYYSTILHGIDYASPSHGLLLLHANNAITFDLEAIRRANPGDKLLRFRAVTASLSPSEDGNGSFGDGGDTWILVDGQERYKRRQFTARNGALPVVIPISPQNRFLTLATTDGGNGTHLDWIFYGDPVLEFLTLETKGLKSGK